MLVGPESLYEWSLNHAPDLTVPIDGAGVFERLGCAWRCVWLWP